MSVWDFILKYSGIASLAIALAAFVRKLFQYNRRPFASRSAVFAYKTQLGVITVCLITHVSNPSSKPVSVLGIGLAASEKASNFTYAEEEPFCVIGIGNVCKDSTPLPVVLSPGETKRIVSGFRMEPSDIEHLGIRKVYSFEELVNSGRAPKDEIYHLALSHKTHLAIEPLHLQCRLQSHRKAYTHDITAQYLDLDLMVLRMSSRSVMEKYIKTH